MKARLGLALLAGAVCLAGGGFAADGPPPEQRRRLQHDEEHRFILTVCPHVSLHAAHGELASVGVHPRRNFSRALRGFAVENVSAALLAPYLLRESRDFGIEFDD